MKVRIISGIVILVLLVLTLASGGYVLAAVLCIVSLIASFELSQAFGLRDTRDRLLRPREAADTYDGDPSRDADVKGKRSLSAMEVTGYLGVLVHYGLLVYTDGNPHFFIGTVIAFFFAETLIYVIRFPAYHVSRLADTVFCFVYGPVLLSFLYLIRKLDWGYLFVFLPFDAWVCDTCAFFSGVMWGKHKLCPKLSPKKTVEGSIGGLIGSTVVAFLFGCVLPFITTYNVRVVWACILIGLSCGVLSQLGDLLASGIKRDRNLKDFGNLIPGHGGIMDRFDSVLFVSPVVYFLIVMLLENNPQP